MPVTDDGRQRGELLRMARREVPGAEAAIGKAREIDPRRIAFEGQSEVVGKFNKDLLLRSRRSLHASLGGATMSA